MTLAAWIDAYSAERNDVKSQTLESYQKAKANLVDYFGLKMRSSGEFG